MMSNIKSNSMFCEPGACDCPVHRHLPVAIRKWKWNSRHNCLLVADRSEVYEEDPGQGTPVMVYWKDGSATGGYACGEGETCGPDYTFPDSLYTWVQRHEEDFMDWAYKKPMPGAKHGNPDFWDSLGFTIEKARGASWDSDDKYSIEAVAVQGYHDEEGYTT